MRLPGSRLVLLLTLGAAACGGGSDSGNGSGNNPGGVTGPGAIPSGTVVVRITDAPFSDAEAVFITFSDVSGRTAGGSFEHLPFVSGSPSRTCDMKHLYGGKQDLLAQGSVPEGHYTGLRFRISSGTLYFDNPTVLPACDATLGAPRGQHAPLTIATPEVIPDVSFDVRAGGTTTIVADLAGPNSIRGNSGGYVLNAVIHIDSVTGP
jgi:hypothetical protein